MKRMGLCGWSKLSHRGIEPLLQFESTRQVSRSYLLIANS